jgi:DNA-binding transcriptional MerR regulator
VRDHFDELFGDAGFVGCHGVLGWLSHYARHFLRIATTLLPPLPQGSTFPREETQPMTDTAQQKLTFKEMCARFDVTPRTLRYYEYIELLQPERDGRSRFYGPRECARMTLILRGRKFGFQLEEIRQWLLIYENEGTEAQMKAWVDMADRQLGELAEQRKQIDEAMVELQRLRDDTADSLSKG